MSYKTLIIIDNTNELTTLNREIIKQTLKYFISHVDKEDKVAIAVTGEKAEYITDFDDSLNTQLKTIEDIEFTDVNAPGADVLMDVILDWSSGDLACRDILYVSPRSIAIQSEYSEEELLFEVNSKLYPIYTLACSQNENKGVIKSMNSLSRISGGTGITTDDAKDDANIEKQLSEQLLEAMKEQRRKEEEKYESSDEKEEVYADIEEELSDNEEERIDNDENYIDELNEDSTEYLEKNENIVYELPDNTPYNSLSKFKVPVITCILVLLIASLLLIVRNRKRKKDEDNYLRNITEKDLSSKSSRMPFEDDFQKETVCLSNESEDYDTGTRLLYQAREGIEITLEDRANPTKYFRVCVRDSVVIGRSDKFCDVVISYDDSISSRHCELYLRDNCIYCRDLSSSNGTMVNQQKVYQEIKIESGDILRIGRLSFIIQIVEGCYE